MSQKNSTLLIYYISTATCRSKRNPHQARWIQDPANFFTGRNEVVAKVMFLLVSVILSTGGGLPQCMLGYCHPPRRRHPPLPAKETPRKETPQEGGTPLPSRPPPPEGEPPPQKEGSDPGPHPRGKLREIRSSPPPAIRSMSGQYASYWNAFLFLCRFPSVQIQGSVPP